MSVSRDIRIFSDDFTTICKEHKNDTLVVLDNVNRVSFNYGEIYEVILRMAGFLSDRGLRRGDTLVSILPNSVEAFVCFMGAVAGGINYAPLPCTVTEREYNNWVRILAPGLVIRKANISEFDSGVSCVEIDCNGEFDWIPIQRIDEEVLPQTSESNVYLMTSGTTGTPKAMSINVNKLWSSGKAFIEFYGIQNSGVRFWNYLPMSYLGGLFNLAMIPIACGGSFVISESFSGKTILNFWDFVMRHEITAIWFVPTIVQGLIKIMKMIGTNSFREYADKIKVAFIGTAPIKLSVKQEFEELLGINIMENFALSETTFLTAETKDNIRYREQSSVGTVLPYVDVKLKQIDGIDGLGRIWVKTPFLFNGYIGEDGKIELELDEEGYFDTKDLGGFNEDGVLVLGGRSRDIIKKGGNFVSLVEIEKIVEQFADVEECAAVPVEHEFYGEAYVLFIISSDDSNVGLRDKIRLWLTDNIVPYKMPEKIVVCDSFPRTASGKIEKNVLKDMYYE